MTSLTDYYVKVTKAQEHAIRILSITVVLLSLILFIIGVWLLMSYPIIHACLQELERPPLLLFKDVIL